MSGVLFCVLCAAFAYLVGGVNWSIILSNRIYGQDIRTLGSHNAGFTNFKRVFGSRHAWTVFALDILKSVVPCVLVGLVFRHVFGMFHLGAAFAAFFVILGHCFPVWYQFKGGKGFLAMASMVWFISFKAGLAGLAVFALVFFTLHYMSLSSVTASLTLPLSLLIFGCETPLMVPLGLACALLITLRHKQNLVRLVKGTEPKFSLFKDSPPK
jgi:glycerol-3-phosphate acyltransferase PlsY